MEQTEIHKQNTLFEQDILKNKSSREKTPPLAPVKPDKMAVSITDNSDLLISEGTGEEVWEVPTWAPTRYLSHDYFRYIGKFPPQIPRQFIIDYSSSGDLVLDPMCGGGTVLIEGRILNRKGIGNDVNPVPLLVSSVATKNLNQLQLIEEVESFTSSFCDAVSAQGHLINDNSIPRGKRKFTLPDMHGHEKYFDEPTLFGLEVFFSLLKSVESKDVRDFLLVALLSVLRSVSHANVKKMNLELDYNKSTRKQLPDALIKKVQRMIEINSKLADHFSGPVPHLLKGSAEKIELSDNSIDLAIVHPPYMSNTAFCEATQLQLAVLGISHKTIWRRELRARGSFLHEPNGVQKYIVGWNRILQEMYRLLRKGRHCAVVVGDGQMDYTRIPVGAITVELANDIGFHLIRRASHSLNHNTGKTQSRKMRDQHILVFQK
jgi:DNA modification methylase